MRVSILLVFAFILGTARADEVTRTVQEQLQAQGAYTGALDGNRTPEFTNALKVFQQRHHLPASGAIDRATAKALDDETGMALPNATAAPGEAPPPATASPARAMPSVSPTLSPAELTPQPAEIPRASPQPSASAATPSPAISPSIAATAAAPIVVIPKPAKPLPSPTNTPAPTATVSTPQPSPAATPDRAENASPTPSTPPEETLFSEDAVTKFVQDFLRVGEGKYVTPQLRFYSFPVDYFGHGRVDYHFVRSDTLRYMRRWPRRRYTLTDSVKVTPLDATTVSVEFTAAFSVQGGKRRANGRTNVQATLRESDGKLHIVAIKEQRVENR